MIITTTFEVLNFFIAKFYCLILLLVLNASRIQFRGTVTFMDGLGPPEPLHNAHSATI